MPKNRQLAEQDKLPGVYMPPASGTIVQDTTPDYRRVKPKLPKILIRRNDEVLRPFPDNTNLL